MQVEWDPGRARLNARKHGVALADAVAVLEDETALTMRDPFPEDEERWITLGLDAFGRVLVVVYTWRGERVRLSRRATRPRARGAGMRKAMKREYDFSRAKRGPVIRVPKGKTRITIRLDEDIIAWFRDQVDKAAGGNYQSLINDALRQFIARAQDPLEETLRRVVREEIRRAS
jgi:uncharacterized DUF497 family protein